MAEDYAPTDSRQQALTASPADVEVRPVFSGVIPVIIAEAIVSLLLLPFPAVASWLLATMASARGVLISQARTSHPQPNRHPSFTVEGPFRLRSSRRTRLADRRFGGHVAPTGVSSVVSPLPPASGAAGGDFP